MNSHLPQVTVSEPNEEKRREVSRETGTQFEVNRVYGVWLYSWSRWRRIRTVSTPVEQVEKNQDCLYSGGAGGKGV